MTWCRRSSEVSAYSFSSFSGEEKEERTFSEPSPVILLASSLASVACPTMAVSEIDTELPSERKRKEVPVAMGICE